MEVLLHLSTESNLPIFFTLVNVLFVFTVDVVRHVSLESYLLTSEDDPQQNNTARLQSNDNCVHIHDHQIEDFDQLILDNKIDDLTC